MMPRWWRWSGSKPSGHMVAWSACAPVSWAASRVAWSRLARRRSAAVRSACSSHAPLSTERARLAYRNRDPFRRESCSATLRRSTRDKEIAGSSRDGGRRLRVPMAAWISGARTRIQGRFSSTAAVGCCGPSVAPAGQGEWMRKGTQEEQDGIAVGGGVLGNALHGVDAADADIDAAAGELVDSFGVPVGDLALPADVDLPPGGRCPGD